MIRRFWGFKKGKKHKVMVIDGLKITFIDDHFKITYLDSPDFSEKLIESLKEEIEEE